MAKHIHLDALGGISGDMFAGALLACWPELGAELEAQLDKAGFGGLVRLKVEAHNDGVLEGTRFEVTEVKAAAPAVLAPGVEHHVHRRYRDIRQGLEDSGLEAEVKRHALGIFHCLAEAEARVHGMTVEDVAFHEVGAWDSIADVVTAAWLIEASGARSWSVSSLPLGRGQVTSAHGRLPVPAPAVSLLLRDFEFHDDGREGERVTPTGAAILRYLIPSPGAKGGAGLRLERSGFGFGSRRFEGLSNILRALVFSPASADTPWQEEHILRLSFEVDDQTPEDLALGLSRIRALQGVLDVSQSALGGKKARSAAGVQVLLEQDVRASVIAACFNETTTLGLREESVKRAFLPRMEIVVDREGRQYRAKLAQRPNGQVTVKAELDDLAGEDLGCDERALLRDEIESMALESLFGDDDEG